MILVVGWLWDVYNSNHIFVAWSRECIISHTLCDITCHALVAHWQLHLKIPFYLHIRYLHITCGWIDMTRCDITKVHCVPDWVWEMNFSRSPTGLTFTADWLLLVSFFWLVQTVGGTLLLFTFRLRTLIVPHVYMCVCEWYFPHFLRDMSVLQWKHS